MTVATALPGPVVAGDRRSRPPRAAVDERMLTRHDDAVAQVQALVPVLRATVDRLDQHVQNRHQAAADFRRAQESIREG